MARIDKAVIVGSMEGLNYIGMSGAFLPNIPARDLSPIEVMNCGNKLLYLLIEDANTREDKEEFIRLNKLNPKQVLIESGLYEDIK